MDRRNFLGMSLGAGLAGMGLSHSSVAQAQGTTRPAARIGWLTAQRRESLGPYLDEFQAGLADHGYEVGRNLVIDYRFGDDDLSRVPALARELVQGGATVIVAQGAAVPLLASQPLPVPLIYVTSGDPVLSGLAQSLARPKPGMTGMTFMAAEVNGKRLEILRDFLPGLKTVAIVANPEHPGSVVEFDFAREKARSLGLDIDHYETKSAAELQAAFAAIKAKPVQAISVFSDGFALQNRGRIIEFATPLKIPVVSGWSVFAQSGALFTYGPRLSASYRRLGYFVHRVLSGSRPQDLPIEQPASFELVVNLGAAKALGIAPPMSVLARADSVLEA